MRFFDIVVFVPVWKRPEITIPALKAMKRRGQVVAAISETSYVDICRELDVDFVFTPNNPLGEKLNDLLGYILKNYNFKWMLQMGSDNFITDETWQQYEQAMQAGEEVFGVSAVDMVEGEKMKRFDYKTSIGAGRCFTRAALLKCSDQIKVSFKDSAAMNGEYGSKGEVKWIPARYENVNLEVLARASRLWDGEKEKYLDNDSEWTINRNGYTPKLIPGSIIDVKSVVNIWPFEKFEGETTELTDDVRRAIG